MAILRVGLSKMKRHIMALRTHRYPWISECWTASLVTNTDIV
jgi:hypothetical protein